MRRTAITWLSLTAVLALVALAPAAAAAAEYGGFTETAKEHAEFQAFANCPFGAAPSLDCSWAKSSTTEKWPSQKIKQEFEAERGREAQGIPSEFRVGNVTVILKQSVTLRGGIGFEEEGEGETWFGAEGTDTIQPVPQKTLPLTEAIDTSLLSPDELNRYTYFVKIAKEPKVTATVELAGPASATTVSVNSLLSEEGTAFAFPVKVKLTNPFLGDNCYVGSDSSPIMIDFTTGTSGALRGKNGSRIKFDKNGFILTLETDTLVNESFASPGVEGCGVEGGADEAINMALGLPSPAGHNAAVLNGTLKLSTAEDAKAGLEGTI